MSIIKDPEKGTYATLTENISDSISASVSVTPIVTYTAENSFAFDVSATERLSFSFIRKNPPNALIEGDERTDDRLLCNRAWIERLKTFIDCWQARSDGCQMTFEPLDETLQYKITRNVYISSLGYSSSVESNKVIKGTIELQIGSMTADAAQAEKSNIDLKGYNDIIDMDDMSVTMTSSDGLATYILYCKDKTVDDVKYTLNCITSYSLKGGPEQPFEYLVMNISKKRLSVVAPNLVNDIIAGRNRIKLNAMGRGQFVVTKCSSSSTTYKIVAYSIYEAYRSISIGNAMYFGQGVNNTPYSIILSILTTRNKIGAGSDISPIYFTKDDVKYAYFNKNNSWAKDYTCIFNNASSTWYVMSVCALMLNCKIWFSDNYAYIVDTSITEDMMLRPDKYDISTNMTVVVDPNEDPVPYHSHISKIYLNTSDPYPLYATETEREFSKSICESIQLGDEGAETICNSVRIEFSSKMDSRVTRYNNGGSDYYELQKGGYKEGVTATGVQYMLEYTLSSPIRTGNHWYYADVTPYPLIAQSQAKYGIKETVYKIPELCDKDANKIAINVANSYCDGEQSVGFKLKEVHMTIDPNTGLITEKYWQKYFPSFTQIDEIFDYSNDLVLSNMSNFLCADVSEYTVTQDNYDDDDVKFYVPQGTMFRINSSPDAGISYTNFEIFDENEKDITSDSQYIFVDNTPNNTATVDIRVDKPCHLYTFSSNSQGTGGKITLIPKDSRQKLPHKLCLSTFEHNFPEGTTEYWFGIMKPTDITQNTSEIHNAMYNQ